MESTTESQMSIVRPAEVSRGVLFLYASLALGLLRAMLNLAQRTSGRTLIVSLLVVVSFSIICFFVVKKVSAGRNWARLLVLIVIALLILSVPITLLLLPSALSAYLADFRSHMILGVLGVVITLLQLLGAGFLLTPNSNQWFKAQK